ncbi:DUF4360 domain-containing protein [Actinomadura spongiicola]|uniref:DUF4360 domain-containing protein n=1 Tax=Actinomadura spongiicola TaxID=2303421 RepID=A0A372G8Q9_9ACTN|nr:DUF4360 domain-containing protein [Actinomadura spongiicola]RFS81784.1 DUF4360 domain-containing protein [Actinomadura spongiicola]
MRKRIAFSAVTLALAAAGPVTPASASSLLANGPEDVKIDIAAVNGSGCQPGTAAVSLASDRESFSIAYGDYTAQAGGSSTPADSRKTCRVNLQLLVPEDYTYAVSAVDYRLRADLQAGAKAVQRASYYFQTDSETKTTTHNLTGPYKDNFQASEKVAEGQLVWKPCGDRLNFNITTELRVDKGTSDASKVSTITLNSGSGAKVNYHLAWKSC